jgi:hypothetical protein
VILDIMVDAGGVTTEQMIVWHLGNLTLERARQLSNRVFPSEYQDID